MSVFRSLFGFPRKDGELVSACIVGNVCSNPFELGEVSGEKSDSIDMRGQCESLRLEKAAWEVEKLRMRRQIEVLRRIVEVNVSFCVIFDVLA